MRRHHDLPILFALISTVLGGWASALAGDAYTVVISKKTYDDPNWRPVADALVDKHAARTIVFEQNVDAALPDLRAQFPKFACFVATPAETTREFVAAVHQMTRKLDDDPYTDVRWGILTGFDAANALRIARESKPLVIRNVASGTEVALDCCTQGLWYDELVKNKLVEKKPKGEPLLQQGPDDTTAALAATLNDYHADLFVTSGHATERNWMIGFRYKNGFFKSKAGQLFGETTSKQRVEIDSSNPKVYLPVGNCLMGHIDGPDAMALAWMNDAGVRQMIGYTDLTWFGYGGWGVLDYFVEQPGRYSLNEAFLANHHALIWKLHDPATGPQDLRGLKYDRDIVAFYGDPAWDARMAPGPLAFEQLLEKRDGVYTFEVEPKHGAASFDAVNTNGSQRGGRPFVAFFPERLKNVELLAGGDLDPVITDDFILVPRPAKCDPSRTYRVRFRAEPAR